MYSKSILLVVIEMAEITVEVPKELEVGIGRAYVQTRR
jgi:hypothetical protein